MRDNLFRRVDRRFRKEQDTDQIIEDLWDDLDDEEFRQKIREDFRGELDTIIEQPDQIYEIDDVMIELLEKGLDQLDSSFEELLDYLEERNGDNDEVYRGLENFLLSWRTFLILSQSIQRNPPEEHCEAVESILRGARKSDAEAVDKLLDEQIEANTLVNGFKKTWSNLPQGDEPQEKRLVTKIEIIEDLFETLMRLSDKPLQTGSFV